MDKSNLPKTNRLPPRGGISSVRKFRDRKGLDEQKWNRRRREKNPIRSVPREEWGRYETPVSVKVDDPVPRREGDARTWEECRGLVWNWRRQRYDKVY